jgi:hypothetical protein
MATIEQRGDFQYRVKLRRRGITLTRTFERLRDAEVWARVEEGRVTGDQYVDRRLSKMTRLANALDFHEAEGIQK